MQTFDSAESCGHYSAGVVNYTRIIYKKKKNFTLCACRRVIRHLATTGRQLLDVMTMYRSQAMADRVTMLLSPKKATPIPYQLQPTV
jgi:hypothetical protein